MCECDKGWLGKECDCSITCKNGGVCKNNICMCKDTFIGELCENTIEDTANNKLNCINNCKDNGKCIRGICMCKDG